MNQSVALLAYWEWPSFLTRPETLVFAIPIIAILVGGIIVLCIVISSVWLRHRERMAMIERGMHPDHPQKPSDPQNQS
jgi:hypothetical protein